eukprot:TRINITY_DN4277_c0_g2_i1.p2 TRINITY_DN4277_c0_g2~~TRINITY_DN4277_c0_g2_i1.p2  ORF type:complete len:153 (-),score=32.18 TRINITY_DN4277_c0_g2_i1:182-586(-)
MGGWIGKRLWQDSAKQQQSQTNIEEKENKSQQNLGENGEGEEDDQEECGFCKWMKAGGCRVEFTAWEECVDKARKQEEDFTTDCRNLTNALHSCMERNRDYYEPLLEQEEELVKERMEEEENINQRKEQDGANK